MKENKRESELKNRIGTPVPILTSGIGTRITDASSHVGGKRKLAKAISISEAQLHRIISGNSQAKVEAIAEIAKVTGVSLAWLATGEEPMMPINRKLSQDMATDKIPVNQELITECKRHQARMAELSGEDVLTNEEQQWVEWYRAMTPSTLRVMKITIRAAAEGCQAMEQEQNEAKAS